MVLICCEYKNAPVLYFINFVASQLYQPTPSSSPVNEAARTQTQQEQPQPQPPPQPPQQQQQQQQSGECATIDQGTVAAVAEALAATIAPPVLIIEPVRPAFTQAVDAFESAT